MSLEPLEQFKNFLEKSKEILIILPDNPSGDAIGSAWGLYFFLQKKNKIPTIAFSNHFPPKFSFLPKPEKILNEISGARDFVLSFDTAQNKIVNIRTEKTEEKFNIYLTPEKGAIDPRDFSFILAKFKYDLLIVLDSPDLENIGKIHETNPDLFFEVPIVNIDHRGSNENFGQINLIDVTASSCSEILSGVLEDTDAAAVDKTIAECLLAGIISATDSFQKKNTTPRALLASAKLMDKGADQQEIVRWLYKTHPLHILKLWGRTMAKMKWDEQLKLVWSEITVEDFVQSRSNPNDLLLILEKLRENYTEGEIFMLLYKSTPESTIAVIKPNNYELLTKMQTVLTGNVKKDVLEIELTNPDLTQAGETIVGKIKEILPTQ